MFHILSKEKHLEVLDMIYKDFNTIKTLKYVNNIIILKIMENEIIDFIKKNNIKLILPIDSDSWICDWKNCGYCCITEKTLYYKKDKCSKFNIRTKECNIYSNREIGCKIFPFMVIFTEDGINLSPSLNCPYILSSVKMNKLLITDVLIEKDVREFIESYNVAYRHPNIENNIGNIIKIDEELKNLLNIKKLDHLKDIILTFTPLDIIELFKVYLTSGAYIQPNYSIDGVPKPLVMNIRLTKKNHIIFKNSIETKIIKEMIMPNTIIINDSAQIAFKQYVKLNIDRHLGFHSLNIFRIKFSSFISSKNAYQELWKSIIIYLYMHLILIAIREKVNVIDYPIMREALSMSDSRLTSVINGY